ncbi:MAG: alpha/beta hydrolase [Pseudomonadota bacterium]
MTSTVISEDISFPEGGTFRRLHWPALASSLAKGTLILVHATGLNASAYIPMLDAVHTDFSKMALSLRGHGATTIPTKASDLRSWGAYADDIVTMVKTMEVTLPLVLVGHSMGGVASVIAAQTLGPEKVSKVVLIEPKIMNSIVRLLAYVPLLNRLAHQAPIVKKAARRRALFPSREDVLTLYQQRLFFKPWAPSALKAYIDEGFKDHPEGVHLSCHPKWEAATFAAQAHGFWQPLGALREMEIPVTVIKGRYTNSALSSHIVSRLQLLGVDVILTEGGHLVPQEKPKAVADLLSTLL